MTEDTELRYTTTLHRIREKLNLHNNEYVLADTIHHLANNSKNKKNGWCYASKETLAKIVGCKKRAIFNMINLLIEMKLVERDSDTSYLRTTPFWDKYAAITTENSLEELPTLNRPKKTNQYAKIARVCKKDISMQELHPTHAKIAGAEPAKIAPYIDKGNNYKDKDNFPAETKKTENLNNSETKTIISESKKVEVKKAFSAVGPSEESVGLKPASLTDNRYVLVLKAFKRMYYKGATERTKAVRDLLPKAFALFEEQYPDRPTEKFIEALELYHETDMFKNLRQKNPATISPKIIFSTSFVENYLLPIIFNQNQNAGSVHGQQRQVTEAELREISKANKERSDKFFAAIRERQKERADTSRV